MQMGMQNLPDSPGRRETAGPAPALSETQPRKLGGRNRGRAWRRFLRHRLAVTGLIVIILLVLMAVLAPVLSPLNPNAIDLRAPLAAPSAQHLLGTDAVGRDLLSRLIFGGRVSLSVGFVAVGLYLVIGTVLGVLAGFYGGAVDMVIMRVTDAVMCFPSLIVIIVIVSILGPGIVNIMLGIGLLRWPEICRLVRGQVLSLRDRDFVTAARAVGAPETRIAFRHVLPNTLSPILVAATFGVANAILTEAGLSFLGLGVQPPTASWGGILNAAQQLSALADRPWMWIPAGVLLSVTVLAINFAGDGLRDALDPHMVLEGG